MGSIERWGLEDMAVRQQNLEKLMVEHRIN